MCGDGKKVGTELQTRHPDSGGEGESGVWRPMDKADKTRGADHRETQRRLHEMGPIKNQPADTLSNKSTHCPIKSCYALPLGQDHPVYVAGRASRAWNSNSCHWGVLFSRENKP